jgi:hypothetical protein
LRTISGKGCLGMQSQAPIHILSCGKQGPRARQVFSPRYGKFAREKADKTLSVHKIATADSIWTARMKFASLNSLSVALLTKFIETAVAP